MLRNVISVKDSHQIFTSLEEFSILFLTLGHLLNGAWILWDLSLKQQEIKNTYQYVQTISLSGLKLSLQLTSWMQMSKRFIWKNIVTRFGVPYAFISDNGLQFDSKAFRKYSSDLGIKNRYSTPAYPQGNGQAEAVNKVIVNGLKKRLDDAKGKWVEELPHVLWTY